MDNKKKTQGKNYYVQTGYLSGNVLKMVWLRLLHGTMYTIFFELASSHQREKHAFFWPCFLTPV